ncbi:protein disulfide-isomerase [Quercus suber]|uniref:protein disulfide-isomerase n=1 Tax=Quercus suber TaxID=58331 RepID=A0AAW0M1G7_QUESU
MYRPYRRGSLIDSGPAYASVNRNVKGWVGLIFQSNISFPSLVQYEKAASILSSHDPPVILAKIDANDEANEALADEFDIRAFPTLKILRNGGKIFKNIKALMKLII